MSGYVEAAQLVVNTIGGAIDILEANRPTVSQNQALATAMPSDADPMSSPSQGTKTFSKWYVQGWDFLGEPFSSQCKVNVQFAWGMRYHGGGAFIPSVSAWVTDIAVPEMWVPWYHRLNITVDPGQPYTQDAGEGQLYACLPLAIRFEESTPVDTANTAWQFTLYGTGHVQQS